MHQLYRWGAPARPAHTHRLPTRWGRLLAVLAVLLSSTGAWAQSSTLINETFEGTNSFTVVNGTATNTWNVGTPGGNGPTTTGTRSAYISNDAGVTYAYTTSAISVVHLYQDVTFPAGQSIVQFGIDWKGVGESNTTYDNLQLFLVPTTFTPTASSSGALGSNSRLQNSGYTPFATLTGSSTYARYTVQLPTSVVGTTQRLVMQWYDDASGGTQPPAAFDNVTLTSATPTPICGTRSVGPTGDYTSLTAAFAAVNLNGVCGPLVLELQSTYASSVETFPLNYTYAGGSATNTVTVRPATGATNLSITGSSTASLLNVNGGKYLILDGRPGGSGATVSGATAATDLTVLNTSASGIGINLQSDATNNVVQHCQLQGVGTSTSYPVVNFSSTFTNGNSNNTLQYNTLGGTASTASTYVYSGGSGNAANSVVNNYFADFYNSGAATYAVYLSTAGAGWTINNNSFYQTATRTAVAYTHYAIYVASGGGHTVANNAIGGSAPATISTTGPATLSGTWTVSTGTAAAFRFVGIYVTGSSTATTVQNNTIGNMSWYSSSGATTAPGVWSGIYLVNNANVQNNNIGNNVTVTSTTSGGISYGIATSTGPTTANINGNTVANLTVAGSASTIAHSVAGIQTQGTTNNVYQNKVYGLVAGNAGVATGILALAGTTTNIYNNLVGNLTAPASTSLVAVNGLQVGGGTTVNAYYNTIYLNATSSGATFGTSGIYLNSTSANLDARNNIVVNVSTAVGTGGYTAALRRVSGTAGTAPANYLATSNNNLLYAGATSNAANVLYVEGTTTATNAIQTLAAYKSFMGTRDQLAVTENPPFANTTTGTAANFLHLAAGTATQVESGGQAITGYTTDYDGDTRNTSTPDIGADEGSFTPNDLSPPTITYTALGNTGSTTSRTLTVTITDPSGIATGTGAPRIYYRLSTASTYYSATATSVTGSSYTFTIDYANIGGAPSPGATIQYYVAAQDANGNAGTNPGGGSGTNPPGSTAPATPSSYQILLTLSGTYYVTATVGSSPAPAREYATLTAAISSYNANALGGAVTFVLLDAAYGTSETFPLTLNNNPDASATNTLTIRPGTGVASTITGSNAGALLTFNGARYVTLDGSNAGSTSQNLTLTNTSTGTTAPLVLLTSDASNQAASYDAVRNTVLTGAASTTTFTTLYGIRQAVATGVTTGATNNTFSNNAITKVQTGISVAGLSTTVRDANTSITGNQIGSVTTAAGFGGSTAVGIAASNQNTLTVTGNVVRNPVIVASGANSTSGTALISSATLIGIDLNSNITTATVANNTVRDLLTSGGSTSAYTSPVAGIRVGTAVMGATVNANLITNVKTSNASGYGAYGIIVNTGTASVGDVVSNNMVSDINGSNFSAFTNSSTAGIYLYGTQSGISLVYNSVNLYGTSTYSSAVNTGALVVESGSTGLTVQNNVLSNSNVGSITGSKPYALYSNAPAAAYTILNNNDYYSSGTQAIDGSSAATSVVVYFNSAARYSLADVRTATTQDAASISADPQFTSATDLHSSAVALNNVGAPVAGVTTDFDGQTRSTTTPDIGADEFTPLSNDLAAAGLVTPATTSTCYGTAETVSVSIRNAGTATLNFASTPATVTVVVTTPTGTQTLTTTVNSGTLATGATQTVNLPGTLNMSAAGTYSFAITATVQGDGNTSNDLLTPSPTRTVVAPVAGTLSPASSTICISGTATLTLAGAANGSIQFQRSTDGTTFTDITGATSATYTTPVLTATTYYRAQVRCNSGVATSNVSTITVNNPQVASTNGPVAICSGSTATITATASAGSQVRFYDAATGGTALNTNTAGSYITPALTASTTYYAEAYQGSTTTAGLPDNSSAYGTFSSTTFTDWPLGFAVAQATTLNTVDVYPLAAGTLTVRLYSVSGGQPGGTATAVAGSDVNVTITSAQVGTRVTVPVNYSLAAGDYKITNTAGQIGRFSTYTGTYPLVSADGNVTVKGSYTSTTSTSYSNTTYNSFFNLVFASECVNGTRTAIQVNVTQPGTASFPNQAANTCATAPYQLAGTVGGGATTGTYTSSGSGTFSPNATTLGATYTPSAADVTAGSVTITLTAPAAGGCPAATATLALTINRAPVATFSYPAGTYCAAGTSTVTPTLGTGATAGTFTASPAGLTINATTGVVTLSSSAAGTYTVTNTVAANGACAAATATATITVTPVASSAFAYGSGTYCASGTTNPTPTITGATGGTFSSTTGLTINASTGVITLASSATGTYVVTYTVAGACGSSSTQSVTISSAPLAAFSYPGGTYCAASGSTVTPTLGTGASAGTFTASPAGLTINATTGVVTLSSSAAGTYTVTNTIAASGGCAAATATVTLTVTPGTTATFSYPAGPYCVSGTTNPTPTITGTAGGTFTSTTGLTLNASTGAVTLSSSTPGTYVVTYTVAGTCGSSSTQTLVVTAAPLATFSYATPASGCAGSTGTASPTLGAGATAGTYTASPAGLTINATTGVITLSSSTAGTYTVTNTVAASGGCAAATATATYTVNAAPAIPTITVAGGTLTSSAATGNQFYLNNVLIPGATGQSYIVLSGAGNGNYTVTVTNAAGCSATSAPVAVTVTGTTAPRNTQLTLHPNPTPDGQVTLELTGYRLATELTVLDAVGRVVFTRQLPANSGTAAYQLDLSNSASGVYVLRLRNADGVETRRLTRE